MAKRVLGKGLSALIGDSVSPATATRLEKASMPMLGDREARMIPLRELKPNPHQPRHHMEETALEELAASIRHNGVLQPVLARRVEGGYELVAGERRFRAAARAGLEEIPALVCSLAETESMKLALLENIQRENLNAMEEAEAYRAIMAALDATHQELAEVLGKSRSTITNMLRLLQLDETIRAYLESGELTMGHARALLAVEDAPARLRLARHAAQKGLSVRALEREARRLVGLSSTPESRRKRRERTSDPDGAAVQAFEERMRLQLGTAAKIHRRGKKGRIEIPFYSDEELEGILERMGISAQL
jgi:ParB family chromosome partitioning protein